MNNLPRMTRRSFVAAAGVAIATPILTNSIALADNSAFTPGVYTGIGSGRNGDITVQVTVDDANILAVEVVSHSETPGISDPAFAQIPDAIVAAQNADVDVAAGASLSSQGIMAAVHDALNQASGISPAEEERQLFADVIVIGAGAGGLAAAAAAAESGKSVIVIEAAGQAGGATYASSGFFLKIDDEYNASLDRNEAEAKSYQGLDDSGIPEPWASDFMTLQDQISNYLSSDNTTGRFDSIECALVDHYLRGIGKDRDGNVVSLDYENLRASFEANGEILNWLAEDGFILTDSWVESRSSKGGKISHVMTPEGGSAALVNALLSKAERLGCNVQYNVRARGITLQDGKVCGMLAEGPNGERVTYESANVVVATGAFSSNSNLVSTYQTYGTGLSADCGSTNPPTNVGDGLIMAQRSGARSRDLQFITTMVRPYHVAGSTADSNAALEAAQLAVNSNSNRFANDSLASEIQSAMPEQNDGVAYLVGDTSMMEALEENATGSIEKYSSGGWLFQGDTLEEVAQAAGLDPSALIQTVEAFNDAQASGVDEVFGREQFNGPIEKPPFIIAKVQVCYHLTFGGLVIDECARVIDNSGNPIQGLFAAGSVLSGFEGTVHQTGDCLNYVVYAGRVAGNNTGVLSDSLVDRGSKYFNDGDFERAVRCFEEAYKAGDLDSYSWLGRCYYQGKGVEVNASKAAALFAEGCEKGDAHCYTWMGKCYFHGEGVEESYEEAAKWFQMAADEGDAYGYSQIGRMLYYGWGVKQDYEKALEYNILAWEQGGYTYVLPMIADAYYNGWGTDIDYDEAAKWYQLGVDRDQSGLRWGSVLGLGKCYLEGRGVEKDLDKARDLLEQVVENGSDEVKAEAQSLLSSIG